MSPTFTAALLTIAKTWKQPKCPLTDAWVKMTWYIYIMCLLCSPALMFWKSFPFFKIAAPLYSTSLLLITHLNSQGGFLIPRVPHYPPKHHLQIPSFTYFKILGITVTPFPLSFPQMFRYNYSNFLSPHLFSLGSLL